jgi:hypothetical protein
LSFFANATASWPVFACAVPALGLGFYLCRTKAVQRFLTSLQLTTVVTALAACFLIAMVVTAQIKGYLGGEPTGYPVMPSAGIGIAPIHWMLVCTSTLGAGLGIVSIATNWRQNNRLAMIVASVCCVVCVVYLVMWFASVSAV